MGHKILHFIPDLAEVSEQLRFLPYVLHQMEQSAEVHVVTLSKMASHEQYPQLHVIDMGTPGSRKRYIHLLDFHKQYLILLYRLMPDIIHIHGSYHFLNSRIELWSRKRGFPVVFSPYGGMNPAYIDAEYGMRTWKLILYQKKMTRNASAIQVCDEEEGQYIIDQRLNQRVSYIGVPMDRETTTYQAYADELLLLYQKVLNTESSKRLDVNCREAVSALLHLSMSDEDERQPLCAEDILNLRSLSPMQWRRLLLFGREQGIYGTLTDGMARMQLIVNVSDVNEVPQFSPRYPKSKGELPGDVLLSGSKRVRSRVDDVIERGETSIRSTCLMLFNIKYHLRKRSLSLRHLCDFYELLTHSDVDEYKLETAMRRLGIDRLCGRVCQVLAETAYLDEGFMPVAAIDDRGTEKIRQTLVNYI